MSEKLILYFSSKIMIKIRGVKVKRKCMPMVFEKTSFRKRKQFLKKSLLYSNNVLKIQSLEWQSWITRGIAPNLIGKVKFFYSKYALIY